MKSRNFTAEHCRERAEELRTIAEGMSDRQARESMLEMAENYAAMERRIERGQWRRAERS